MPVPLKALVSGVAIVMGVAIGPIGATWSGPLEDAEVAENRGDYVEALKQYRFAAEQGDNFTQFTLGLWYSNGYTSRYHISRDCKEAVKWFRLAASQEYRAAQTALGNMYSEGNCVPRDYVRAHMWHNIAAATESKFASYRDRLEQMMTPQQIAEAQRLARECQQHHFKDCD